MLYDLPTSLRFVSTASGRQAARAAYVSFVTPHFTLPPLYLYISISRPSLPCPGGRNRVSDLGAAARPDQAADPRPQGASRQLDWTGRLGVRHAGEGECRGRGGCALGGVAPGSSWRLRVRRARPPQSVLRRFPLLDGLPSAAVCRLLRDVFLFGCRGTCSFSWRLG